MKKILVILSFIPWLLFFYSETKANIVLIDNRKDSNILKENFLNVFPIYDLILYIVLIYFSMSYKEADNIFIVRLILFSSINLYLFFNNISKKDYKLTIDKPFKRVPMVYIVLSLIPIILYLITKRQMTTYYIMLAFNILNHIIISIVGTAKNEE